MKNHPILIISLLLCGCGPTDPHWADKIDHPETARPASPKPPDPPKYGGAKPWDIVCDRKGHWTFLNENGYPIEIEYTRERAVRDRDYIKRLHEERARGVKSQAELEQDDEMARTEAMPWQPCNEPEFKKQPLVVSKTTATTTWDPSWVMATAKSSALLSITSVEPTSLIIQAGKGTITISYKDGTVKLDNVTMDAAGRLFWDTVAKAFPEARAAIIRQAGGKP